MPTMDIPWHIPSLRCQFFFLLIPLLYRPTTYGTLVLSYTLFLISTKGIPLEQTHKKRGDRAIIELYEQ